MMTLFDIAYCGRQYYGRQNIIFFRMSLYTEPEVHNRLSILSHKDIKLPHLDDKKGLSTTKVLQLIKQKKMELFPSLFMSESTEQQLKPLENEIRSQVPTPKPSVHAIPLPPLKTIDTQVPQVQPDKKQIDHSTQKPIQKRYKTLPDVQQQPLTLQQQFYKHLSSLPQLGRYRTVRNMQPLVTFLSNDNPFFKSLPAVLTSSLLKVCCIRSFPSNSPIYRKSDKLTSFYVILWGRVKITDVMTNFKKHCGKGETLSEQVLFADNTKLRQENAKTIQDTTMLEVPAYLYKKIYEELTLYGYKNDFLMMETVIRRGYIEKQSMRNK